jgi:hypothetical protein
VPAAILLENATRDQLSDEFVILRQEARHRLLEGRDILVFSKPKELMEKPPVQFGSTKYILTILESLP